MKSRMMIWGTSSVVLGVFACTQTETEPDLISIKASTAALTAQQNTERLLRGWANSAQFFTQSQTLAKTLSLFGGTSETCTSTVCQVSDVACTPSSNCTTTTKDVTIADLEQAHRDVLSGIDDLVAYMRDDLFKPANLEVDDGKTVIYKLGPELFCDAPPNAGSVPVSAGGATSTSTATSTLPTLDATCVSNVTKLSPRLKLTSTREGDVDMALLLTENRMSPVTFQLYQAQLGAAIDLGAIQAAADTAGVPLDGVAQLSGKMVANLTENGALDYEVTLSIPQAVSALLGSSPQKFALNLSASPEALRVRFDGNARTMSGSVAVSGFTLDAPLGAFFSDDEQNSDPTSPAIAPRTYTGSIHGSIPGMAGQLGYESVTDSFSLSEFGFGGRPSTVTLDGKTLLSVDVNPSQNHAFDLLLDSDANGPNLSFGAGLDIEAILGFSAIASQVTDLAQMWLNDSLKIKLTGSPAVMGLDNDQMRVKSGSLTIASATQSAYQVTAIEGQCLVSSSADAQTAPSYAALFSVGTCQ